jgi:hypothetical protein
MSTEPHGTAITRTFDPTHLPALSTVAELYIRTTVSYTPSAGSICSSVRNGSEPIGLSRDDSAAHRDECTEPLDPNDQTNAPDACVLGCATPVPRYGCLIKQH